MDKWTLPWGFMRRALYTQRLDMCLNEVHICICLHKASREGIHQPARKCIILTNKKFCFTFWKNTLQCRIMRVTAQEPETITSFFFFFFCQNNQDVLGGVPWGVLERQVDKLYTNYYSQLTRFTSFPRISNCTWELEPSARKSINPVRPLIRPCSNSEQRIVTVRDVRCRCRCQRITIIITIITAFNDNSWTEKVVCILHSSQVITFRIDLCHNGCAVCLLQVYLRL